MLGRNDLPFDEMVKLDYIYVTNWSLWWDIKILCQTIPVVSLTAGGVLMNVFVVPAYNEEDNLPRLFADLEQRPQLWADGRLIVVDDGSSDATAERGRGVRRAAAGGGACAGRQPGAGTRVRPRLPAGARR